MSFTHLDDNMVMKSFKHAFAEKIRKELEKYVLEVTRDMIEDATKEFMSGVQLYLERRYGELAFDAVHHLTVSIKDAREKPKP